VVGGGTLPVPWCDLCLTSSYSHHFLVLAGGWLGVRGGGRLPAYDKQVWHFDLPLPLVDALMDSPFMLRPPPALSSQRVP
jgi:hypothetical protein